MERKGFDNKLVTLEVHETNDADVLEITQFAKMEVL